MDNTHKRMHVCAHTVSLRSLFEAQLLILNKAKSFQLIKGILVSVISEQEDERWDTIVYASCTTHQTPKSMRSSFLGGNEARFVYRFCWQKPTEEIFKKMHKYPASHFPWFLSFSNLLLSSACSRLVTSCPKLLIKSNRNSITFSSICLLRCLHLSLSLVWRHLWRDSLITTHSEKQRDGWEKKKQRRK